MSAVWILWLGWLVSAIYWLASWALYAPSKQRESGKLDYLNRIALTVGFILLFRLHFGFLERHLWLWHTPESTEWFLTLIGYMGFALSWWAHLTLGRRVRRVIVTNGPYRYVRHPMFLGLIIAAFATAAVSGTIDSFLGAIIVTLGWYWRAQVEEQTLREELNATAYNAYVARTAMMVPFIWLAPFRVGAPGRGGE